MRDKVKHYSCFQYLKSIFLIGHDAYYDDYKNEDVHRLIKMIE